MVELKHKSDRSVPERRQLIVAPTVDRLAADHELAARRLVERAEQVQQRALARSARADDRDHLTARDAEIDAVENV